MTVRVSTCGKGWLLGPETCFKEGLRGAQRRAERGLPAGGGLETWGTVHGQKWAFHSGPPDFRVFFPLHHLASVWP